MSKNIKKSPYKSALTFILFFYCILSAQAQQTQEATEKGNAGGKATEITSEENPEKESSFTGRGSAAEQIKWQLNFQLAILFGRQQNTYYYPFMGPRILGAPSLQVSGGYRLNQWLQPGLGVGLSQFGILEAYPIFAYIKGNLSNKSLSPYYCIKAGQSLASLNNQGRYQEVKGGFMGEGQAGIEIRMHNIELLFGGGYHLQKVEMKGSSQWGGWQGGESSQIQKRNFNRLIISSTVKFSF